MISPAAVAMLAVVLYPLYFLVRLSFSNWTGVREGMKWVGLENFAFLFVREPNFWKSVRVTLVFVVIAVTLEVVLGLGLALLVHDFQSRLSRLVKALFLVPIVLTPVVSALTYKTLIFEATGGVGNYFLDLVGLPTVALLGSAGGALFSVLFVDIWHWTPFVMLILLAGLTSLPEDPYDAARVDGASAWQIFRYVTLPLMIPVLAVATVLRTIDAFRTFDMVFALTGGGPGTATQILPLFVYQTAFQFFRMGRGAAAAVVLIFLSSVFVGGLTLLFAKARSGAI